MNRPRILATLATFLFASSLSLTAQDKPNILWIFAEDTSPWMGCYGHEVNEGQTPNIDSLASQGALFTRAYVPAPVCSACRSAIMGGQNQIRFGAHEHRSSRGPRKIQLPDGMKLLPQIMKEGGYYTFNLGKDDYNFAWDQEATYSLQQKQRAPVPWGRLTANQPFFGQIQTAGGKQNTTKFPAHRKTDPSEVTVPADYPQNQLYREVVAEHYDSIRKDDDFIGEVLAGLKASGMWENTIIVYFSDHGANNLVRHKQMPTEGGLHVPLIVTGPKRYVPNTQIRDDLVDILDLSTTTLAWAGLDKPDWYEGQNLFASDFTPRSYVASAKDRLDHTIDRVRTIRTDRFRYTRNYLLDRILLQPQYRDDKDYTQNLHELYKSGKLSAKLSEIYFGERQPEELYDVERDPHQLNNLAKDPKYVGVLKEHRALLDKWIQKGDAGSGEEPAAELAFQLEGKAHWKRVNPEYESLRADSDGDGLTDDWEGYYNRDPKDGKLLFTFESGGWQTEGWQANHGITQIAGYKGYLDFDLPDGQGSLVRTDLNADLSKQGGQLAISLRVTEPTQITLSLKTGKKLKPHGKKIEVLPSSSYTKVAFPIPDTGKAAALQFDFQSLPNCFVEIDRISSN
ncbi:MAG: sulfatase [Verrucomicrobiota bacterium]